MRESRPFQAETVEAVFSAHQRGVHKQLVVLATGLGKTYTTGLICDELPRRIPCLGRVLWLTHTEDLVQQSAISVFKTLFPQYASALDNELHPFEQDDDATENALIAYFRQNRKNQLFQSHEQEFIFTHLGLVKEELFSIEPRLVVASVQTIRNRLDRINPDHFDMVVCDEAHLFASETFSKTVNYFTPKIRLGLTATPKRLDGLSLSNLFEEIIIDKDIKFGIENGYLCELIAERIKTSTDLSKLRKTGGDFNLKDLRAVDCPANNIKIVNKYKDVCVKEVDTHIQNDNADVSLVRSITRPAIAFCVDVEHCKNLVEEFQNQGFRATFVVSDKNECPDRGRRIRDFKAGKYDVLCNINILTAGFDYPNIGCVIQAAPTMSLTKYLQSVGRGTRNKDDFFKQIWGNNCIIIDMVGNTSVHGVVNTWTLDSGKPFEEQLFLSSERRLSLIAERNQRRLEHVQEKDETVALLRLPDGERRGNPTYYDMNTPATQPQLEWLKKLGYDTDSFQYMQVHAQEIINNQPATARDIKFLTDNGYDVSNGCTRLQAQRAMKEIASRNGAKKFNTLGGNKLPFSL
jgi:superfamily II DNA or RNA helicase